MSPAITKSPKKKGRALFADLGLLPPKPPDRVSDKSNPTPKWNEKTGLTLSGV